MRYKINKRIGLPELICTQEKQHAQFDDSEYLFFFNPAK